MTETQDSFFPVVIIGAGLAGLTAAVHLAERGITPIVLEADSRWPGGRLSGGDADTFEYKGRQWSYMPDHGVHAVWGNYHNLRNLIEQSTNTTLVPSEGEEWINRWGRAVRAVEAGTAVRSRWIPAPFHYLQLLLRPRFWRTISPWDFLSLPGFLFSILWTIGFDPIREKTALDGLMMQEYFRGWTPNLKATFKGLGENLLAAPYETISLSAFIAALRFYTVLRRDSWGMHYFPGNSHDSLIAPLVHSIESSGGRVMQGVTAQALERCEGGWRIIVEDNVRPGRRSFLAQNVILATYAPSAQRLLLAGADTAPEAEKLRFPGGVRSTVVRAWFSKSPRKGTSGGMFTGDFVPDNFFWLHRMYGEFREWHEATGGSAIEVHLYGTDSLLDQPEKNLLILAVDDIQRAFPEVRGSFVYGAVRRNSRTHTQFRVPTNDSLHVETPWPGIYACGDWIGYPSPAMWMERAVVTGIAAANQVLKQHSKAEFPIQQIQPPEPLVRILVLVVSFVRLLFTPIIWAGRRARGRQKG
ncbi:MAG: FAD-dependent oxidoreductase [bacterium]|nr:FAD-dependent oxidoreductase [bacterium]